MALLARAAHDAHPQVRMEAILACGQSSRPEAIQIAAQAVTRHPTDKGINYAFTQAVYHQERNWLPALTEGRLDFGSDTRSLAAVLQKRGSRNLLQTLLRLARSKDIDRAARQGIFNTIASIGGANELRAIFEPEFHPNPPSHTAALIALRNAENSRGMRPKGELNGPLRAAFKEDSVELRIGALRLAGEWNTQGLRADVRALAQNTRALSISIAAVQALGRLRGGDDGLLTGFLNDSKVPMALKLAALDSLSRVNMKVAATFGVRFLEP